MNIAAVRVALSNQVAVDMMKTKRNKG